MTDYPLTLEILGALLLLIVVVSPIAIALLMWNPVKLPKIREGDYFKPVVDLIERKGSEKLRDYERQSIARHSETQGHP